MRLQGQTCLALAIYPLDPLDPSNGSGTMFLALLGWKGQMAEYKLLKRSVGKKMFATLGCLHSILMYWKMF